MENVFLSIVLVLVIIYIVPFLVYGLGSVVAGLKTPAGVSPAQFLMGVFVFGEIGQTFGPGYSWREAVAGVISETIYLPLSAWLVDWLIIMK